MASQEEKLINVILKYSTEGASQAASVQEEIDKRLKQGYAALDEYNKGNSASMKQFVKDMGEQQQAAMSLEKQFHSLRMAGFELRQLGTLFTLGGGLLTAGITADANNYVKTVGAINEGNAQWLMYENQIKNANLQIGETARDAILPTMKNTADLLERIAGIVKSNPWMIQGALTVGGIMLAIGATLVVVSELARAVGDMGLLLTKAGMLKTAAGGGAELAGAGIPAGIGLAVLGLATEGAVLINVFEQMLQKFGATKDEAIAIGNVVGQMLGPAAPWLQFGAVWADVTNELPGFVKQLQDLAKTFGINIPGITAPTTPAGSPVTAQEVDAFIAFQKQINDATNNYEGQRADAIKQYEQQIKDVTAQYESQRADLIANYEEQVARSNRDFSEQQGRSARDFQESQDKALRNYNEQVAKSERDFRESQAKATKQHQLEMAQLEQQHNQRMSDLVAARDALGLIKEKTSYDLQVQQKNQTFNQQRADALQQHQQQLDDQHAAFKQQQSDAQAAYDQQRADAQAAHAQQMADMAQNEAQQLAKMDEAHKLEMIKLDQQERDKLLKLGQAYQKQIEQIQSAFIDRLRALDAFILGDSRAYTKYLEDEAQQFQQWLNNFKSQAGSQLRGVGGGVGVPAGALSSAMAGRNAQTNAGGNLSVTVTGAGLSMTQIQAITDQTLNMRLTDLLPAFGR
jgi:hypothetical protein